MICCERPTHIIILAVTSLLMAACSGSSASTPVPITPAPNIEATVATRVDATIAALATPTQAPSPTPNATATPTAVPLPGVISGTVLYDGRALREFTSEIPSIVVINSDNAYRDPEYDIATSRFAFPEVAEGTYRIVVSLDVDENGWPRPGDFVIADELSNKSIDVVDSSTQVHHNVDLVRVIHLTDPWDNDQTINRDAPLDVYRSQELEFRWEPLAEADHYELNIFTYSLSPPGLVDRPLSGQTTTDTFYRVLLQATPENQAHRFNVKAYSSED